MSRRKSRAVCKSRRVRERPQRVQARGRSKRGFRVLGAARLGARGLVVREMAGRRRRASSSALRWIDTWAYLISVPFLMLMIFGIVVENPSWFTRGRWWSFWRTTGGSGPTCSRSSSGRTRRGRFRASRSFSPLHGLLPGHSLGPHEEDRAADRHVVHSDRPGGSCSMAFFPRSTPRSRMCRASARKSRRENRSWTRRLKSDLQELENELIKARRSRRKPGPAKIL